MEGKAITEYASLSGKIHTLVIDKTLSIGGAAADAKAVGDALDKFEPMSESGVQRMIDEHANKKDNPHGVTAEQVGTYTKDETMAEATKALFGLDAPAVPDEAFALLLSAVNRKLEVATGSYVGTGSSANSLTFDFEPQVLLVSSTGEAVDGYGVWFKGSPYLQYHANYCYESEATLTEKTVAWSNMSYSKEYALNLSGITYNYLAIGL